MRSTRAADVQTASKQGHPQLQYTRTRLVVTVVREKTIKW